MHELSIAESILDAVHKEIALHPGTVPTRVGIKTGSTNAIAGAPRASMVRRKLGTDWAELKLDTNVILASRICNNCRNVFVVEDYNSICPACSSSETTPDGGDELDLEYLEVENAGTSVD